VATPVIQATVVPASPDILATADQVRPGIPVTVVPASPDIQATVAIPDTQDTAGPVNPVTRVIAENLDIPDIVAPSSHGRDNG